MKSHDSHSLGLTLVRSFPSERHESWAAAQESSLRLRAVSPAPHCRACVLQDGVAGLVLRHARVSCRSPAPAPAARPQQPSVPCRETIFRLARRKVFGIKA